LDGEGEEEEKKAVAGRRESGEASNGGGAGFCWRQNRRNEVLTNVCDVEENIVLGGCGLFIFA